MTRVADWIKIGIALVVLLLVGGFLFKTLFKLGILALIVLGVVYLFNKVMGRQ